MSCNVSCIPHYKFVLNLIDTEKILKLIREIQPEWNSYMLHTQILNGGITNSLIRVHLGSDGPEDSLLVRIYGKNTDKIICRSKELELLKVLHSAELGPKLHATFLNGIVYQYFPGVMLTQNCFHTEKIFKQVAKKLAMLHHQIDVNCSTIFPLDHPVIWTKIENFLMQVPELPSQRIIKSRESYFSYDGASDYELKIPSKTDFLHELAWLKVKLEPLQSPLVLCHNDLLLANIIFDQSLNTVHLIDFEYAGPNYQAYDIANHFNEYASGVDFFDSSMYPKEDFQRAWLSVYVKSYFGEDRATEERIATLLEQVKWFRLVSHLFCSTWGLFQIAQSDLPFDFHGYTFCRISEYFKLKTRLLGR